ncbi:sensor histidine kinase [Arthrobacter sp. B0490]|uniref:sensor histidine kinase n=1 Tax=Arthrobacter sp. B0490 TaxID=2058891 RepID=UPI000CE3AC68|nr:histidine kinase [Arthrobacter sp. B0490]
MALFPARRSLPDPDAATAHHPAPAAAGPPETGRGVRATWRYTIGSIVFYSVFIGAVDTLFMLSGGDYGLQLLDVTIILLAAVAVAALVRYCWFFRTGLGGGLPARKYTVWLLLPAAGLWLIGLLQSHTLWVAAVPLWFAANAIVVVVARRARWWVLAGALAALVLHGMLGMLLGTELGGPAVDEGGLVSVGLWALMTPLLFVGSIWWWEIVLRLDDSRRTSGELAVARERLRFAADLHDIQGHHLQVIALKTELAGRLLDADPEAARVQIREAQQLARTALEETRALVHGYRAVSLAAEAANAAEVLRAAGIDASVEVDAGGLPPEERTLFGLVIREATTNILRHSEATCVAFRLVRSGPGAVLSVTNDGVTDDGATGDGVADGATDAVGGTGPRAAGSGIDGLRQRFEAVGGSVDAGRVGGRFVLTATVPVSTAAASPGPSAVRASAADEADAVGGRAVDTPASAAGARQELP